MSNEWTRTMDKVCDTLVKESIEDIKRTCDECGVVEDGFEVYKRYLDRFIEGLKQASEMDEELISEYIGTKIDEWMNA